MADLAIQDELIETLRNDRNRIVGQINAIKKELQALWGTEGVRIWRSFFSKGELILFNDRMSSDSGQKTAQGIERPVLRWRKPFDSKERQAGFLPFQVPGEHPRWEVVAGPTDLFGKRNSSWEYDLYTDNGRFLGAVCGWTPDGVVTPDKSVEARAREIIMSRQGVSSNLATLMRQYFRTTQVIRNLQALGNPYLEYLLRFDRTRTSPASTSASPEAMTISPAETFVVWLEKWLKEGPAQQPAVVVRTKEGTKLKRFHSSNGFESERLKEIEINDADRSLSAWAFHRITACGSMQSIVFPGGDEIGLELGVKLNRLGRGEDGSIINGDEGLTAFFTGIADYGSCGFFPLGKGSTPDGLLIVYAQQRTFFNPFHRLLLETMARTLSHLPGHGLPEHDEELMRCSKFGLIYNEAASFLERKDVEGLLFFDMNRFKHINDTLGHGKGDSFIQSIMWYLGRAACVTGAIDQPTMESRDERTTYLKQEIRKGRDELDVETLPSNEEELKTRIAKEASQLKTDAMSTPLGRARLKQRLGFVPVHFGGDEFGMLFVQEVNTGTRFSDERMVDVSLAVLADLLQFLREIFGTEMDPRDINLSAGLELAGPVKRAKEVLRNEADKLMYQAKRNRELLFCLGHTVTKCRLKLVHQREGSGLWVAEWDSNPQGEAPRPGMVLTLDEERATTRLVEEAQAEIKRVRGGTQVEGCPKLAVPKHGLDQFRKHEVMPEFVVMFSLNETFWLVKALSNGETLTGRPEDYIQRYVSMRRR